MAKPKMIKHDTTRFNQRRDTKKQHFLAALMSGHTNKQTSFQNVTGCYE